MKGTLELLLNRFFLGRGPRTPADRALNTNVVRLVDKAILAYELGRKELFAWNATPNTVFSPLFRAVDAFEDLVLTVDRASRYIHALSRRRSGAVTRLQRPDKDLVNRIRELRNWIAHTDEYILKGQMDEEGGPQTLLLTDHGLFTERVSVTYAELADLLRARADRPVRGPVARDRSRLVAGPGLRARR